MNQVCYHAQIWSLTVDSLSIFSGVNEITAYLIYHDCQIAVATTLAIYLSRQIMTPMETGKP